MHSYTRRFMQASPQIHNPVGLIPDKQPQMSTTHGSVWTA